MLNDFFSLFCDLLNLASSNEYYLILMGFGIILLVIFILKKTMKSLH